MLKHKAFEKYFDNYREICICMNLRYIKALKNRNINLMVNMKNRNINLMKYKILVGFDVYFMNL